METKEKETKEVDKKEKSKETKKIKEKTIKIKESEHAKLIEEAGTYKDKYVRLYAEFENARKRMEREKQEFVKYANEELIIEFIGILDNLEFTVQAAQSKDDGGSFLKGVEMVMAHIHDVFRKNGVKSIEAKGKKFDPHYHEVLMQEETDQYEDGIVIEELQKGYLLGDKVVRTVKVKVARKIETKDNKSQKTEDSQERSEGS